MSPTWNKSRPGGGAATMAARTQWEYLAPTRAASLFLTRGNMGVLARIAMIGGLGLLTERAAPPPKLAANESVQRASARGRVFSQWLAEIFGQVFGPAGQTMPVR